MLNVGAVREYFHKGCVIVVCMTICVLAGCEGNKLTTRAYPLGQWPKTTEAIVKEIVIDDVVNKLDDKHQRTSSQGGDLLIHIVTDEGYIVVKTTAEGHRKIKASLQHLGGGQPGRVGL